MMKRERNGEAGQKKRHREKEKRGPVQIGKRERKKNRREKQRRERRKERNRRAGIYAGLWGRKRAQLKKENRNSRIKEAA